MLSPLIAVLLACALGLSPASVNAAVVNPHTVAAASAAALTGASTEAAVSIEAARVAGVRLTAARAVHTATYRVLVAAQSRLVAVKRLRRSYVVILVAALRADATARTAADAARRSANAADARVALALNAATEAATVLAAATSALKAAAEVVRLGGIANGVPDPATAARQVYQAALAARVAAVTANVLAARALVVARSTSTSAHARLVKLNAAYAAAHARLRVVQSKQPRDLALAQARQTAAANRNAAAARAVAIRTTAATAASASSMRARAAFASASTAATTAANAVPNQNNCPPPNVFAGASRSVVYRAPGLSVTRYAKAGRNPMYVTSTNLAGAGAQVRPGPLNAPVVASRTLPAAQLRGSHALAAVNGDFYYIGSDFSPWGSVVTRGGAVRKGSSSSSFKSLIIDNHGVASANWLHVDIQVHHGSQHVTSQELNSRILHANGVSVFTSAWGHARRTVTVAGAREYFVNRVGTVYSINNSITTTAIPAGGRVIVAQGIARNAMSVAGIGLGAKVSVTAKASSSTAPAGVYSSIGAGLELIHNGVYLGPECFDDHAVARTIIGIRAGGLQMFTVTVQGQTDGATSHFSGLSVRQAQAVMKSLGAYEAIMLDGGGSTILSAAVNGGYAQLSHSPVFIRPVPNSLAFWRR